MSISLSSYSYAVSLGNFILSNCSYAVSLGNCTSNDNSTLPAEKQLVNCLRNRYQEIGTESRPVLLQQGNIVANRSGCISINYRRKFSRQEN